MASTGTQPEVEIVSPQAAFAVPSVSNAHRWTDLVLVLTVAFSGAIIRSTAILMNPQVLEYSNQRLFMGLREEVLSLALFYILFKRQGRTLKDIGFSFRWLDIPIALGLTLAGFIAMFTFAIATSFIYSAVTHHQLDVQGPSGDFSSASLWFVLPFQFLNPFFEEMLVRGYLMTELITMRNSVGLAAIVSLVLQTSYHLYYGFFGAAALACGLAVFAIYYAASRRLMPVILAHMLWDFTSLLKLHH